jgi:glycosyltransferase involved in cell wall biosynthesis
VPNAIDATVFDLGPPVEDRPEVVLAMISEDRFKRLDVMVEAIRTINRLRPEAAVVGFGVGPRPGTLPSTVEYHQSPRRDELAALYRTARVYMCSSDAEGWHLPPAEALVAGAALVSTDIGGVRAYAEDAALFSPVGDGVSLGKNAVLMLTETALAQRLSDVGRTRLLDYGPDDAAAAFSREVLASRAAV